MADVTAGLGDIAEVVRGYFDQLRLDLVELVGNREMWKDLSAAIRERADPETPATWLNHYARLYSVAQMVPYVEQSEAGTRPK